jgi:hypothetical protein
MLAARTKTSAPTRYDHRGFQVCLEIGGVPFALSADDPAFVAMLANRYANFLRERVCASAVRLRIELTQPRCAAADAGLEIHFEGGRWVMRRGDFHAEWDSASGQGMVRQSPYPYAIDSVIRIMLSLMLAGRRGFLLHSASAVRGGRAFLFCGVSGAGKTTIARLAPSDSVLLSDEISCLRRIGRSYYAFGTPFAGDLGVAGEELAAPVAALYFLRQGARNRIEPIDPACAAAELMRNILFFANDSAMVEQVFETACDFCARVAAAELTFKADHTVWELIR